MLLSEKGTSIYKSAIRVLAIGLGRIKGSGGIGNINYLDM